jgi:antibiotic biosynthesis monooxygenase (ABM) superfamily enzyme
MSSASAPADHERVGLGILGPRVSTVVIQRVPADRVQRFLDCQRGLTAAAERFAGYRGTELYPPPDDRHLDWVSVIHFDNSESLTRWIDSPERTEWIKKLRDDIGDFQLKTLPSGFGAWFAGLQTGPEGEPPPSWKIAMTVLLGLYPTVMVLALLVGPYLSFLGLALSMLISNALSVALTQWVVIPPLMNVLGPWLRANGPDQKVLSFGGLALIWLLLIGVALMFRVVSG